MCKIVLILSPSSRLPSFSFSVGQPKHYWQSPNHLCLVYGSYLVFQLFSHKALYHDSGEDIQQSKNYEGQNPWLQLRLIRRKKATPVQSPLPMGDEEVALNHTRTPECTDTESEIETYMSVPVSLGLLVVVTVVRATPCVATII
jgi:Ca2+:H+ antiporter